MMPDKGTKPDGRNLVYWKCKECGMQLGVLPTACDELQIKYKDLYLFIKAGTGGSVRTICRKCGTENVLNDSGVTNETPAAV